ncbi:MAG: hypothetical protein ABSA03_02965 [Streptosporangiaceae bacterium]|jgi:hypothetical protein
MSANLPFAPAGVVISAQHEGNLRFSMTIICGSPREDLRFAAAMIGG